MEAAQPFRQVVHPVETDQCRVETRVAIEMLLQKAEVRLMPHAVFDKEEGSGAACGRCGRRQFLDLRSHSTPPSKVGLRCVGCHRQRGSASCDTQRPRLARDRKHLLILVISTEARKRPAHYTLKKRPVVNFFAKSRDIKLRGTPYDSPSTYIPNRSHAEFEPARHPISSCPAMRSA